MVRKRVKASALLARIRLKWLHDRLRLPLTNEHYPLYEIIHRHYHRELGRFPDLVHCPDFNDKIQWLKLFDQDDRMIQCSDKLRVRDFVAEKVGKEYLVPLLQKAKTFDELDFEHLPDSFVLKANHDSGTVTLVRDKISFDAAAARMRFGRSLSTTYGWEKGEWAYSFLEPEVLVEQFIDPEVHTPPPDFKYHCVNGSVKHLQYIYDRGHKTKEQMITRDGVYAGYIFDHRFHHGSRFVKPNEWDEMIHVAETLSAQFKYVRVDMYLDRVGRVFVGELTFWPMAGCYHGEGQKVLGRELDFDRSTFKEPIYLRARALVDSHFTTVRSSSSTWAWLCDDGD